MDDDFLNPQRIIPAGSNIATVYPLGLYLPKLYEHHLRHNSTLTVKSANGILKKPLKELFSYIEENDGKKVYSAFGWEFIYSWEHSLLKIDFVKKTNTITVIGYLTDPKLLNLLKEIKNNFITKETKNSIFTVGKNSFGGLELQNMGGESALSLIKENYNPEVIEELDFVVDAFKRKVPPGRICLLNGEPGTGKTHLIRTLLSRIDNLFLILPSNMISSLDKPEFIPFLLRIKSDYEKPIILIIEDGDACLVPRKADNMSTIACLLNISDGILGNLIDIKMIITSNSNIKDIDPAILRPGRLCKNISVNPLPYDRANAVYKRLMEDETVSLEKRKFYTLAEVYAFFNTKDLPKFEKIKTKSIGFHPDDDSDANLNVSDTEKFKDILNQIDSFTIRTIENPI